MLLKKVYALIHQSHNYLKAKSESRPSFNLLKSLIISTCIRFKALSSTIQLCPLEPLL